MGLVVSLELARLGWTVFAGVRRAREFELQLANLRSSEGQWLDIRPVQLDVTSDESVAAAVAAIGAQVDHIGVVINNAGVPGTWAPAEDVGPAPDRKDQTWGC